MNQKVTNKTKGRAAVPVDPRAVFLGIEGGATRWVAILADEQGRERQRLEHSEPANLRLLNDTQLRAWLRRIAQQVGPPAAVGIGLAGVVDHFDSTRVRRAAAGVWPGVPLWVGNDLETALAAANIENPVSPPAQVMIVSGTGAACYGRGMNGEEILTGGWGHLLGDRGSGYDIALRALQAVFWELDEKGRCSPLGQRLFAALQVNSASEAAAVIGGSGKSQVAALALEVFASAAAGDPAAKRILSNAALAIADTASACARRLSGAGQPLEFILNGSVLLGQPRFGRQVTRCLRAAWPDAAVRLMPREGAWGAVSLAQQQVRARGSHRPLNGTVRRDGKSRRRPADLIKSARTPVPPAELSKPLEGSPTEQRNPRSKHLDRMSIPAAIRLMFKEEALVPVALLREKNKIARLVEMIARAMLRGGRLIYVGAGTSGRLALLDAHECPPTFGVGSDRVQAVLAGGQQALLGSFEGAEDDFDAGARAVRFRGVSPKDVVVGISASGRTPFVWGALGAARKAGAKTVLVCFNPNLQCAEPDRPTLILALRTGPEVLTGSTRLKAGTATKILLNTLSTLVMVRLGNVAENLMVNVQTSNSKLRERALRIVEALTGATRETAQAALHRQRGSAQRAVAWLQSLRKGQRRAAGRHSALPKTSRPRLS